MHELIHIKRHDYLVNLMLVSLETLFFFNPVVLLMTRDLRKEMEFACDQSVTRHLDKLTYAKVLLRLQVINVKSNVAVAAKRSESEFKERIDRIVGAASRSSRHYGLLPIFLLCTLLAASAFGFKQPAEVYEPEVITPVTPAEPEPVAQDTIPEKKNEDVLEIYWPKDKDTLLYEGRKFVWLSAKDKKPKSLRLRLEQFANLQDEVIRVLHSEAPKKAKSMMTEIHEELIKDGIISLEKPRIILMFQYSDILQGEATLGSYYPKYKAIFNRHFPKYDSFATTRAFSYKAPDLTEQTQ